MLMRAIALLLTGFALALPVDAQSEVVVGELLIVDKSAGQLVRLDLASGVVTARLDVGFGPHEVAVVDADQSPTGQPLAVVTLYGTGQRPGSSVALVDLQTGSVTTISTLPFTRPHGVAHVPGTSLVLVTAEAQDTLLVLDLTSAAVTASVPLGSRTPHMVVAAPDGSAGFATAITGGSVMSVAIPGHQVSKATVGPGAEGVAVTKDGAALWVGSNGSDSLYVLDASTLEVVTTIPTCGVPIRVTAVGADLMAATCMDDALIQLFDVVSYELVSSVTLPGGTGRPVGTLATPDGQRLYIATTADGRVHELDVAAGTVTRSFEIGVEPDGLAFGVRGP